MFHFEVHGRGEQIVKLPDRVAVARFFGLFEVAIPDVVFDTLLPGVRFVIQVKASGIYHPLTLLRVAPFATHRSAAVA